MFRRSNHFIYFILTSSMFVNCQASETIPVQSLPTAYDINYQSVNMPDGAKHMGLAGLDYRFYLKPWFFVGPAFYGAVNGDAGGLFTLGMVTGIQQPIAGPFSLTADVFAGGGGGHSSPAGGGAMIKPEVGVLYKPSAQWGLGLNYHYINFPSGTIHSSGLGLSFMITSDWLYAEPIYTGEHVTSLAGLNLHDVGNIAFHNNYFSLLDKAYIPAKNISDQTGAAQTSMMNLAGFEFGHFFNDSWFFWLNSAGVYSGAPKNGYMDFLTGVGYHYRLGMTPFSVIGQLGVGAGGGGNVDTGGGLLVAPSAGIEYDFTKQLAARVNAGYLDAPNGHFRATTVSANLIYRLDLAEKTNKPTSNDSDHDDHYFTGWQAMVFNQTYLKPQRTDSSLNSSVNLLAMQLNQEFTPWFYMAYQSAFAYHGNSVGGLATGMIGPGFQTLITSSGWQAKTELLIGAGGGGNLALGGGALIEPNVGVSYHFNSLFSADAGVGRIISMNNKLNTTALNVGLRYNFASLVK